MIQQQLRFLQTLGFLSQSAVKFPIAWNHSPFSTQAESPRHLGHNTGSYILREWGLGEFDSNAPLSNIRSIRTSIGAPKRSRPSDCISGLRLDYHNERHPAIVGQWISEGDCFEIHTGEEITCLSLWLTQDEIHPTCQGEMLGRLVGVRVETSKHRRKTIPCRKMHVELLQYQFRSNRIETLVCPSVHPPSCSRRNFRS